MNKAKRGKVGKSGMPHTILLFKIQDGESAFRLINPEPIYAFNKKGARKG